MVLVVVDVVVVGVPEGAGASCVVVVSVVVVASFFWQPAEAPRIPAASREPRAKSFFTRSALVRVRHDRRGLAAAVQLRERDLDAFADGHGASS